MASDACPKRRARVGVCARVTIALLLLGTLASCTATARISDVYMALDSNGDRKRNVFFTDTKEIHCVVEAGIGRKGTTVEALVRQLQAYDFVNDRFFDTDRISANIEVSPVPSVGIQKTDFVLRPQAPDGSDADGKPFPPGRFQCEAYLDGKPEGTAIYNVAFAECPVASIRPGTECYGFYTQTKRCPKYGLASKDPAQCRCSTTKGWECDR